MAASALKVEDFRRSPGVRSLQGMNVIETDLPGVLCVEPRRFRDARGYFFETFRRDRYEASACRETSSRTTSPYPSAACCAACTFRTPGRRGS